MGRALECDVCHRALPAAALTEARVRCGCGEVYRFEVFPECFRPAARGQKAEDRQREDAACYFHPGKSATAVCDACGRLVCSVCDVAHDDGHCCASCLAAGNHAHARGIEHERWMQDSITLLIAAVPPFTFPLIAPVTASVALYRSFRYWRAPLGPLPRSRVRFVVAALLALAQWGGVVALAALLLEAWRAP